MKAFTRAGRRRSGKVRRRRCPTALAGEASAARDALIEMVAEADETLMEKFFEAGTLTQHELITGLQRGDARPARIFPLRLHLGAAQHRHRSRCSTRSLSWLPSPADRPFTALDADGADGRAPGADDTAPLAAFVWKTVADQFAGRITLFRVYQGTLKADSTVHNATPRRRRAARPA